MTPGHFYAVRHGRMLHIRVAFVPAMAAAGMALTLLVLSAWCAIWWGFQRESTELRTTFRVAMSGALVESLDEVMKHAARMAELSACHAEIVRTNSVNRDLAKMVNMKEQRGTENMGGTP